MGHIAAASTGAVATNFLDLVEEFRAGLRHFLSAHPLHASGHFALRFHWALLIQV
jgi:hypothetical protein